METRLPSWLGKERLTGADTTLEEQEKPDVRGNERRGISELNEEEGGGGDSL